MLRETLSKIFSSRVFFVIFSLLAAVALWMYVEITENEELPHRLNSVPVVFINEDSLRDRGLHKASHDPQTVELEFEVSRAIATRLTNSTVSVEVDLAGAALGHTAMLYNIILPSDVNRNVVNNITSRSVERISLNIDRVSVRTIPVRVEYTGGTASDDLVAQPVEFDPQTISVEGPEGVISRIDYARVPILRENLSSTYIDDLPFILIDEYGEVLDGYFIETVRTSQETIRITVPVIQIKDVPLVFHRLHGAGSTEQNTTWTVEPPFITVSGDPEALRGFNYLELGAVNMTRFSLEVTESLAIALPGHINNESGEISALVSVEVGGLAIEDFSVENLVVINTLPGHTARILSPSINVRLRGRSVDLADITAEDIRVVADLRDYGAGRERVPARVYIDGTEADIGAIGLYHFNVIITPDTPPASP